MSAVRVSVLMPRSFNQDAGRFRLHRYARLVVAVWTILAHQGGWDEFLLVLGPIAVIAAALAVAKRRVDAQSNRSEPGGEAPER
jgi:hypothetical protein